MQVSPEILAMPEPPHPRLMIRQPAVDAMAAGYGAQLELLTQLTNYGSNLGIRAFNTSDRTMRDLIVCHVLLKQFTRMLDATDILMRAGAAAAARVPVRVAFEAAMFAEWMLVADGERKAACYVVGNLRATRLWTKRAIADAPERQTFLQHLGPLGGDIRASMEDLPQAAAHEQLQRLEAMLTGPRYLEVNAAFDAYKKAHKGGEPEWYKVAGKNNLREIAIQLQKLPEYIIFYAQGSEAVHSARYSDQIRILHGGVSAPPVRDLTGTHNVFNAAGSIAIILFQRILGFYRPQELPNFGRQYVEDWRPAYRNIPIEQLVDQ
jgi:Family of unknown function (DUF5677)